MINGKLTHLFICFVHVIHTLNNSGDLIRNRNKRRERGLVQLATDAGWTMKRRSGRLKNAYMYKDECEEIRSFRTCVGQYWRHKCEETRFRTCVSQHWMHNNFHLTKMNRWNTYEMKSKGGIVMILYYELCSLEHVIEDVWRIINVDFITCSDVYSERNKKFCLERWQKVV